MSWLDDLKSKSDLLPTGEVSTPLVTEQKPNRNPIEFISHLELLVNKVDDYITELHAPRQRQFRSHMLTLQPSDVQTISEDFMPDKWFIVTDTNNNTFIGVFPSSGRPVAPDMFTIGRSDSMTIPGLSQYMSVTNLGTEVTTVTVIALIGFDIDYDPPSSGGLVNVSGASTMYAITPDDVAPLTPVPRSVYVGVGGNIITRGLNDAADVTFVGVPSGTVLPIQPRFIRNTNTTATNLIGLL